MHDGRATPEDNARRIFGDDFKILCEVAKATGCTMEQAAESLRRVRQASGETFTHVKSGGGPYVQFIDNGGPVRPHKRPEPRPRWFVRWGVWLLARILDLCGWRSSRVANGPIHNADIIDEAGMDRVRERYKKR